MVAYGYRFGEVKQADIPGVKEGTEFTIKADPLLEEDRIANSVSLGIHIEGACPPKSDLKDRNTGLAGAAYRYCRDADKCISKPVDPDKRKKLIERFRAFCKAFVRHQFVPIEQDADCSVRRWVENTNYPEWRRKELLFAFQDYTGDATKDPEVSGVNSFIKEEYYVEADVYKHARPINSRSDIFKCRVGPIFKLIEESVYSHPSFIKHVPVPDRPSYIMDMLYCEGGRYLVTDYTSFESLFTKDLMEACEIELYDWMSSRLPEHKQFMADVNNIIAGRNHCKFGKFTVDIDATRMSGEMCTSLGNGFANLMFMNFLCHERGSKCTMVVEGDDGVTRVDGVPPTKEDFETLGLLVKLEEVPSISEASFCGIVFDPIDRINVTSPLNAMLKFGWTSRQYVASGDRVLKKLLRSKALSMLYEYGSCPILGALAEHALRMTTGITKNSLISFVRRQRIARYDVDRMVQAIKETALRGVPGINTRLLVESRYGIPVESQLRIENYFDGLDELKPIPFEIVSQFVRPLWADCWSQYVLEVPKNNVHLYKQIPLWGRRSDCPSSVPIELKQRPNPVLWTALKNKMAVLTHESSRRGPTASRGL